MKISCKINSPLFSALIIYISLRKIKKIKTSENATTKFLVLGKEGGLDDLTCAYEKKLSNILYFNLNRKFIKIMYNKFFIEKLNDYDYNYPDKKINKKKYFNYLDRVFFNLSKFNNFKGLINFNIFYYAEVELQKVCKKQKKIFLSIHKEGLHPPVYRDCLKWIYKNTANKFYGSKVFLYNNDEKKCLIESKVCKPNQVFITGMPRLSQSYKIKKNDRFNNKYKNNIIIYQSQERYLPYFNNKNFKKPNHPLFNFSLPFSFVQTELTCIKLLKKIKSQNKINLTIKTRTGQKQDAFKKVYKGLNVISGGAGHKLLENNEIVIAFNSTIILEALAAGKIVFTPNFVKDYKKNSGYFFDFHGSTILDRNIKSFQKNIIKVVKNRGKISIKDNNKKVQLILNKHLFNSDNKAGDRLVKEIEKYALNT